MVRWIIAAPLILHGIAHLGGFISSWTSNLAGFADHPWLLSSTVTLRDPFGRVFGLVWLVAMVTLVSSGVGLITGQVWWPTIAMVGATLSLVVILPWWNTVPPGAKIGVVFNVLVIIILLLPLKSRVLDIVQ
jgi:hypothetical protein